MTVGVDVGGRKIALVSVPLGIYATFEVKAINYERFYREASLWLKTYHQVLKDEPWLMEAPVVAGVRNLQSTIRVAQTTGLVHAHIADVQEIAVSSWKKATVGNGNASKEQVRKWLEGHHPQVANNCRGNQDLIDAACISISAH